MDLPTTEANSKSDELRSILRVALMRRLLSPAISAFPVIGQRDPLKVKVVGFRPGPTKKKVSDASERFVLEVATSTLDSNVQDKLVGAGLKLVRLTPSIEATLRDAATALQLPEPRPLDARTLCDFLRSHNPSAAEDERPAEGERLPLCETKAVREMLRFVINEVKARAGAKARPGQGCDLSMLQGVPLLLLHDGQLRAFDEAAGGDCAICCMPVARNTARRLSCGHIFHDECIYKWLRIQPTCPQCRQSDGEEPVGSFGAACLWNWHELLPFQSGLFIDKAQQVVLLGASPSRKAVEGAAATLGARPFRPAVGLWKQIRSADS